MLIRRTSIQPTSNCSTAQSGLYNIRALCLLLFAISSPPGHKQATGTDERKGICPVQSVLWCVAKLI